MSTFYENEKEMSFLCRSFDEELETCNKKHRLKKKGLKDGPHSSCYVRIIGGCPDFEARKGVVGFLV